MFITAQKGWESSVDSDNINTDIENEAIEYRIRQTWCQMYGQMCSVYQEFEKDMYDDRDLSFVKKQKKI